MVYPIPVDNSPAHADKYRSPDTGLEYSKPTSWAFGCAKEISQQEYGLGNPFTFETAELARWFESAACLLTRQGTVSLESGACHNASDGRSTFSFQRSSP